MNPEIPPSSILEQELLKRNGQLEEKVARLEKENRILRELRRLDLIKKYGPGSESLSLEQLELLELEPGVNGTEVEAEAQREPIQPAAKKERKHPGRQELPAHLERIEQIIPCTPEQCVCGICGQEKQVIGYEASEVLDVEPAKYFVQVTKREKRACKGCEEGGVSCAPLQDRIIEKGLGSDRVVIDAVINKILFSSASLSPECDFGTRKRTPSVPSDAQRLDDARGRDVNSHREGNGSGTFSW